MSVNSSVRIEERRIKSGQLKYYAVKKSGHILAERGTEQEVRDWCQRNGIIVETIMKTPILWVDRLPEDFNNPVFESPTEPRKDGNENANHDH